MRPWVFALTLFGGLASAAEPLRCLDAELAAGAIVPSSYEKYISPIDLAALPAVQIGSSDAYRVQLPQGQSAVRIAGSGRKELEAVVNRLEEWKAAGHGLNILAATLAGEEFHVLLEDFAPERTVHGKVLVADSGLNVSRLRDYSFAVRQWVRDRMEKLLDKHPDPHVQNVMFRVTELEPGATPAAGPFTRVDGNHLTELVLVDPDSMPQKFADYKARGLSIRDTADETFGRTAQFWFFTRQMRLQ